MFSATKLDECQEVGSRIPYEERRMIYMIWERSSWKRRDHGEKTTNSPHKRKLTPRESESFVLTQRFGDKGKP